MFYLKTEHGEIPIDVIYTRCFNCGKELEVDSEMLLEILSDGDIASTQVACCQKPALTRIK